MTEEMDNGASSDQAVFRINNLKGFLTVLNAIKPAIPKQICSVELGNEGLKVKWEDDSKSLQSSLFIGHQLFADYSCPWVRKQFGVPFNILLDSLSVFLSIFSTSDLIGRFPGANEELILEMIEDEGDNPTTISTFAQLDSREIAEARDLADHWEGPASFFLIPGSLLKEAVEDMEWAAGNGSVSLKMLRDPPSISLSASGTGDLVVAINADTLQGYQCTGPVVQHSYKFKNLRAMVANLPHARDASAQASTKVTIDNHGLIKMTHMLNFQGQRLWGGGPRGLSAIADSQHASASTAAVVQFMSVSEELAEGD